MIRSIAVTLFALAAFAAANFKLYLKDGTYHITNEYKQESDRVRRVFASRLNARLTSHEGTLTQRLAR